MNHRLPAPTPLPLGAVNVPGLGEPIKATGSVLHRIREFLRKRVDHNESFGKSLFINVLTHALSKHGIKHILKITTRI